MGKDFVPYEKTHKLQRLLFVTVVVRDGQRDAINAILFDNEAFFCASFHGRGTAPSTIIEVMGIGELKKDVIMSVVKEERWPLLKKDLEKRFGVSSLSKGIAYVCPVDSVMGVSIYKMLSNTQFSEKLSLKERIESKIEEKNENKVEKEEKNEQL
ncbi:MAG TPA: hypothetical protein DEF61_04190 [Firmicutes bacterium]|nr:hypothetical protein [Bacillota bacterium]HBX25442.1 hypothetical protein [Bacillota bacterium]